MISIDPPANSPNPQSGSGRAVIFRRVSHKIKGGRVANELVGAVPSGKIAVHVWLSNKSAFSRRRSSRHLSADPFRPGSRLRQLIHY